ncbi:MAG: chemotaxis protein CheW, partial [Rhodospirillaceae bacterium]|nr:chemotaxis protein CheW [Rhodospirillaceae bacterium]
FVESPPVELIDHLMHYVAESAAGPPVAGAEPKTATLPTPPVMVFDAAFSDPALVELFIEQAREEIARIDRNLPAWRADAADAEAGLALQRAFHRLSDASRIAGARLIGEYAGRIERLLDRVARQALEPTEPVRALVAAAAAALPELLEQLEVGTRPQADIALLMQRAEAFAPDGPQAAGPGAEPATLDGAGEIAMLQARLQRQLHSIDLKLNALARAVTRLREQFFDAADETAAPRRRRDDAHGSEPPAAAPEADRAEAVRRLSRALVETANEAADSGDQLRELTREADTGLSEEAGVPAALDDGLVPAPAVPFGHCVSRLAGIVQEAAAQCGKAAELVVEGAEAELDRRVIERLLPAFEHLLRHAVIHGIEAPAARLAAGKPGAGRITVTLQREGPEVVIELADDGAGPSPAPLRREASGRGLAQGRPICTEDTAQLVLKPGLTAVDEAPRAAGRGAGLDVVDGEIKRLGGSLRIEAEAGRGTRFIMRLPRNLATDALIVRVGEAIFALPLSAVEGMTRVAKDRLLQLLTEDEPRLEHSGVDYRLEHLGTLVGTAPSALPDDDSPVSLVLVRAGDSAAALITDALEGSREVVVETPGPQVASVPGVTGAAALSDGGLVTVLDIGRLVHALGAGAGRSTDLAGG